MEDHAATTAESFLDLSSPRHELWREDPTSWVFRGQGNAEWELKPTGQRDAHAFAHFGITLGSDHPGPISDGSVFVRVGKLNRLLDRFRMMLEQAGIIVPTDSPSVSVEQLTVSNIEPRLEVYALITLAQHHGLPTFLLDWTRRAWNAAYFAAVVAADHAANTGATHLAVWAIKRSGQRRTSEGPNFYEAPGSTNANLHAQAGLFTFVSGEDQPSIEVHTARLHRIVGAALPLRRVSLAIAEAPKLLRLLSYEGIDGSAMFPGADGVVRAMRESALWDRPKR